MTGTERQLTYGRPCLDESDIEAVVRVLQSEWLTTGPAVARFERALAEKVGARFAAVCNSGTAALHMAVDALGLGPGQAAVVPAITFLATANAARYVGAEVIFADVDPHSGLMGDRELRQALARYRGPAKPTVVLPVHFGGQCVDPEELRRSAGELGLHVVEDACHALGTTYTTSTRGSVPVGACNDSELCTFSFHAVKTVTMGEGGAVTTNDRALYERLVRFRNHGMDRDATEFEYPASALDAHGERNPWYYEMPRLGFNYRATDFQCALGLSQLARLDRFVERRRALVALYDSLLLPLAPAIQPLRRHPGCAPAWHLYVALIDFAGAGIERAAVMKRMQAQGIGTQVHYIPVPWQPYYRRLNECGPLPGTEAYYAKALSLPLFPDMEDADVHRVVAALSRALGL